MNAATTSKLLGITDDSSVCECCGKRNLKRVAVIELANGSIVRYGRDCAARELGKAFAVNVDSAAELMAYVQKWLGKTDAHTPEVVAKGIQNKRGFNAKVENGRIYAYMGSWVALN